MYNLSGYTTSTLKKKDKKLESLREIMLRKISKIIIPDYKSTYS